MGALRCGTAVIIKIGAPLELSRQVVVVDSGLRGVVLQMIVARLCVQKLNASDHIHLEKIVMLLATRPRYLTVIRVMEVLPKLDRL